MHLRKLLFSLRSYMCNGSESGTSSCHRRNSLDILYIKYNVSETGYVSFVMCNLQEKPDPRVTLQLLICHSSRL